MEMEARVAVLESKFATMQESLDRLSSAIETANKEIHAMRDLVAAGRGIGWVLLFVLNTSLSAAAGALASKWLGGT